MSADRIETGPLDPAGGKDNPAGQFESALATAWQGEWDRRVVARDEAKAAGNDALAQHFQAELDVMAPVMAGITGSQTPPVAETPVTEHREAPVQTPLPGQVFAEKTVNNGESSGELHLPPALEPYRAFIQDAAEKSGMPAEVLAGMIWDESRGNLEALSTNGGNGQGDTGLMQVNPETFKELKAKYPDLLTGDNLSDPETNILAGALYLKDQVDAFGSVEVGLRAYNSGPLTVNPDDLSDISKTGLGTASYVDKVTSYANVIATGEGTLPDAGPLQAGPLPVTQEKTVQQPPVDAAPPLDVDLQQKSVVPPTQPAGVADGNNSITFTNDNPTEDMTIAFTNNPDSAALPPITLKPGETLVQAFPEGWSGNFRSTEGDGVNVTLGEVKFDGGGGQTYYDVSYIEGYNTAMTIEPVDGGRKSGTLQDLASGAPESIIARDANGNVYGLVKTTDANVIDQEVVDYYRGKVGADEGYVIPTDDASTLGSGSGALSVHLA